MEPASKSAAAASPPATTSSNNNTQGRRFPSPAASAVAVTLHQNDLSNNGPTYRCRTASGITVDAAENYWGTGHTTPATVPGVVSGNVNFEPIVTSSTDTDMVTPGFQPDLTSLAVDIGSDVSNPSPVHVGDTFTLDLAPANATSNNTTLTQWVINWGDGGPTTTVTSPTIPASVTHVYATPGGDVITATATDELTNTAASNTVNVTVLSAAAAEHHGRGRQPEPFGTFQRRGAIEPRPAAVDG